MRGTARLTEDELVLEESIAGYYRRQYEGYWRAGGLWRKTAFVCLLAAIPGALLWALLLFDARTLGLYLGGVVVLLAVLRLLEYGRGVRSPDSIPLDAIDDVTVIAGRAGVTRPRIVVRYEDGDAVRKCRINLPSRLRAGEIAPVEDAVAVVNDHGLPVKEEL